MSSKGSKQKSPAGGSRSHKAGHGNGHVIPGHNSNNHHSHVPSSAATNNNNNKHGSNHSSGNHGNSNNGNNKRGSATYGAAPASSVAVDILPPSTASILLDNARSAQAVARFDHSRTLPLMIKKAERYRDITCPRKKITVVDGKHTVEVFGSLLDPTIVNGQTASVRRRAEAARHHIDRDAPDEVIKETEVIYEKHSIWEFKDFAAYGLGTMLYFDYLKQLTIMFCLIGILMLPTMVFNIAADNSSYTASGYRLEKTTLGNVGRLVAANGTDHAYIDMGSYTVDKTQLATINGILDLVATLFLIGYLIFINKRQALKTADYKRRSVTSPQYTIQVTGLPAATDRLKLANFFGRFGTVVDVAMSYNNYELIEAYRHRGKLRKDVQAAISHKDWERVDELWAKIGSLDNELKSMSKTSAARTVMAAFVTFERQEDRIACVRAYNSPWYLYTRNKRAQQLRYQMAHIEVEQAPEPSNILFRNLKYTSRQKCWRRLGTALCTLIVLCVSLVITYVAQYYQRTVPGATDCPSSLSGTSRDQALAAADGSLERDCYCQLLGAGAALINEKSLCSDWLARVATAQGLTLAAVFTIVLVNYLLAWAASVLGRWEKHTSLTHEQRSITIKLFVGLFLNTGVVLLLVNASVTQQFGVNLGFELALSGKYSDFTQDWFSSVGVSLLLTMLLQMFNPHILPLMLVPLSGCRRNRCLPKRPTQTQLNERFAGNDFDLAERYAALLSTMFVSLFYAGGMPLLWFTAAATYFFTYWFDKTSFLRLYKIPPRFGASLSTMATEAMPWAIMIHCALSLWFFTSPVLTDEKLSTTSIQSYDVSTFRSRLGADAQLPLLIIFCLLAAFLLIRGTCGRVACMHDADDETLQQGKFIPYSEARKVIQFESYHVHSAPQFYDAFRRTPSMKQMAMEVPLDQLEAERRAGSALPPLHHRAWTKEKAREVFITLDRDANGLLTHNELLKGMRRMLVHEEHVKKFHDAPVSDTRTAGGQPAVTLEQFWKITAPPHLRVKPSSRKDAVSKETDALMNPRSRTPPQQSSRHITNHTTTGSIGKSSPLHATRKAGATGSTGAAPSPPVGATTHHKFGSSSATAERGSIKKDHHPTNHSSHNVDAAIMPPSPSMSNGGTSLDSNKTKKSPLVGAGHVRQTSHSRTLHDDISRNHPPPPPPPDFSGILPGATTTGINGATSSGSRQTTKQSMELTSLIVANEPSPGKTTALASPVPSSGTGRSQSLTLPSHPHHDSTTTATYDDQKRHDSMHDVTDDAVVASAAAAEAALAATDALAPQLEARAAPLWPIGVTPTTAQASSIANGGHGINGNSSTTSPTNGVPLPPPSTVPMTAFTDLPSPSSATSELVIVDLQCPACNAALQVIDMGDVAHYRCPFCSKRFSM